MSKLLPTHTADHVRTGITNYLTTNFSLADQNAAHQLEAFLSDPENGMYRGPYIRTRLPYAPAQQWENTLGWLPENFTPYQHQAEAFQRLASTHNGLPREPEPTLVVTGTGSGKTESFLYPIINHCLNNPGPGVKALILYPMNALANDQAKRLAELLEHTPELATISAALYTGESSGNTTIKDGKLITDRATIRQNPPDILLTNYKMLDQLLLRTQDRKIWTNSANTLQYLVLDEFHTYDGAQGTDVALLLRRLGLLLKQHQPKNEAANPHPLGKITPIATSATLGAEGDPSDMLDFAHTIFGRKFAPDSLIGETSLTLNEWQNTIRATFDCPTTTPPEVNVQLVKRINEIINTFVRTETFDYAEAVHNAFCSFVFTCAPPIDSALAHVAQHPFFTSILTHASAHAIPLSPRDNDEKESLIEKLFTISQRRTLGDQALTFINHALAELAYLRSEYGAIAGWKAKIIPGVETHLWVRAISRIDRALAQPQQQHAFRWSDDGIRENPNEHETAWLPACYCRHCGRAGWMTALDPDNTPVVDGKKIRTASIDKPSTIRPLIDASLELSSAATNDKLHWFNYDIPSLTKTTKPAFEEAIEAGRAIAVLTHTGQNADELAHNETCPACGEIDAIRYLGSSIATLLSVALSNLFGQTDLDDDEKKTLIFTDSVQDAAHRAGFVQDRSHTFAQRTQFRAAVNSNDDETPHTFIPITHIPETVLSTAQTARQRFELLPPKLRNYPDYQPFWDPNATEQAHKRATTNVRNRLAFDALLEFGDRSDLTRSLVSTGALSVKVNINDNTLKELATPLFAEEPDLGNNPNILGWVHGILEHIRINGGINHPWLGSYLEADCNSYLLNRYEARKKGIPSFPIGGAPKFPRHGAPLKRHRSWDTNYRSINAKGFYAKWTARILHIPAEKAAALVAELLTQLAKNNILDTIRTNSNATIYAIPAKHIHVGIEAHPTQLECTTCRFRISASNDTHKHMEGLNCWDENCTGTFHTTTIPDNYYRKLYQAASPKVILSAEHTSLLKPEERLLLEEQFKGIATDHPDAPNVLVATPTLEMGIDIGDLSSVMLSSLPKNVANYVQRVGRAGRATGNSFILALAQGHGKTLPQMQKPLSMISGTVRPPAAFLSAEEILHRQFLAFAIEQLDLTSHLSKLYNVQHVFGRVAGGNLVDIITTTLPEHADTLVTAFIDAIRPHGDEKAHAQLQEWVSTGTIYAELRNAQTQWAEEIALTKQRMKILNDALKSFPNPDVLDEDQKAQLMSTRSTLAHLKKHQSETLTNEYWISAMERYGLLPNYTLLDDSVELNVNITKSSPDTMELDTEKREYTRGVSTALFELALGNSFYAQGIKATIDSVEVGTSGSKVETWRLCPNCAYATQEHHDTNSTHTTQASRATCPMCRDARYADQAQLIPVLPLRKVSAQVDYSSSTIDSSMEERHSLNYHKALTLEIPNGGMGTCWYISSGFGIQHLRRVNLRWLNLGRGDSLPINIGGKETKAPLFQVCRHCGHIDKVAKKNQWRDHKPWCEQRKKDEEDNVSFALGRSLSTEGIFLQLPHVLSVTDSQTLPSLIAALRLGFQKVFGGDPNHLDVAQIKLSNTTDSTPNEGLLLHDTVPGGTGYLSQFTSPDHVRTLLKAAWDAVKDCTCKNDGRLCCDRCLLPYAPSHQLDKTSRSAAENALFKLLVDSMHPTADHTVETTQWQILDTPVATDPRSDLESRFFYAFRNALKDQSITLNERVRSGITEWEFTIPGSKRVWRMREQVNLGATIPDFYFSTEDPAIADLALYLDGAHYHISTEHMRAVSDVYKRNNLTHDNIHPWILTWNDISAFDEARSTARPVNHSWFNPTIVKALNTKLNIQETHHAIINKDPLSQLLAWLKEPNDAIWEKIALAYTLHRIVGSTSASPAFSEPGWASHHTKQFHIGLKTAQAILNSMIALRLDAAEEINTDSWNEFLTASNLIYARGNPRDHISMIVGETSSDLDIQVHDTLADLHATTENVDALWAPILEEFADEKSVYETLVALHAAGILAPTSFGEELHGIATIAVWEKNKIALVFEGDETSTINGWAIYCGETSGTNLPAELLALKD